MVTTGSKPCGLPMQTAGGGCEVFLPADSLDLRSCLDNHHSVCFIADCGHCCLTPTAHLSVGFFFAYKKILCPIKISYISMPL